MMEVNTFGEFGRVFLFFLAGGFGWHIAAKIISYIK